MPETTILGLGPGDVFVHRNIANIITSTDPSALAVIEYAVSYLGVKAIVVCGHEGCGGVAATMGPLLTEKAGAGEGEKVLEQWLGMLREIKKSCKGLEEGTAEEKGVRLVEENVKRGVEVVRKLECVEKRSGSGVTVHGMVYSLKTAKLRELDC